MSEAILSVILSDNTVIYSAAANTAATTEGIPRMTVVAFHSDSGGMPFIRVTCFNPTEKVLLRNVYLRNEGVSARPSDDVQAAILLQLAAGSKSARQQKAFLSSAIKDYPDSAFAPDLQAAMEALAAPATGPAPAPPEVPAQPSPNQ